eukprot:CAMPEP_0171093264 /NCGR_PEP_ID=MMETSP0766_2-20121228/38979_1 /TAXON_ID=439317 /ORGANISM="Gambierdiscus australes, Strain CAWD 149" /LENGTH=249 /DNA_ID=CAMNT_0011551683 /DNA_START=51 /DNA_END=800 /DNA_ORIENTATION=-
MARKPIVGGNWKCNPGKLADAETLLQAWSGVDKEKIEVFIAPTALHIGFVKEKIEAHNMMVCAQNVSKTGMGAFTGEWSAEHLKDMAIGWTLIGHSERRSKYGETDEDTAVKVEKCQEAGVKVVLCIGEQLSERESGKTDEVNQRQLEAVLPKIKDWDQIVLAYEPVWAIGTGKVATPDQAEETHANIRKFLETKVGAEVAAKVRIQYGGSVSPENCADLISKPNIDGFLVGGASLKPTFMDIITKSAA